MLMDQNTQWLYQLLAEVQLEKYYIRVRDGLNITRVEHFNYVKESDLEQIGISKPAQRRLYDALKRYKTASRSRQWFPKGFSRGPDGGEQAAAASVQSPDVAVRPTAQLINDGDLSLGDKLGSGSFGVVRKGEWHSPSGRVITVAVKLLRGGMSRQTETLKDFLLEVTTMQSLDHPHIIRLYGVVLTHPFKMVTELASHGSLYDKLRARQYKYPLLRLWLFATQIADGMDYLESRRFLHRDLAARNVLLSSKEGVKIGDFGLMRGLSQEKDHYIMGAHKRIPFAWCAPESLRVGSFSHASDVWMFGITMWEMFTYCEEPWFGLSGREILSRVEQDGERLDKPPDCPQELYGVMRKCWALNPAERPHFAEFITILKETKPTQVQVLREFSEPRKLPLAPNDIVTLIDHGLEMSEWRGQNQRTLDIGWFPPSLTVPPTTSTSMGSNLHPAGLYISPPMMGSLQHRGHGDIHSDRSWGSPERLDDTASWRTVLGRENGGSNLQKMAGLSQSLESVLSGQRPPDQSAGPMKMNQQGRLMPPAMNAPSMVTQKDPRRFSEAGPVGPPRPPPPNMRRFYVKPQRKPIVQPPMGNPWPSQMVPTQPRTQGPPQQGMQGSNLLKMAPFSRSTPQLDDERGQNTKDNLIALVMEAVHGVTTEDVQRALQSNEWNPTRAEQQLKLDQLYFLSLCSAEDCVKILQKHKWDLQEASKYLIRLTREEKACAGEGLRPQISAERRV